VPLCGRDVWRISREVHLAPERFVVAWREEDDGPDRFRLEPDGPRYTLVLGRRGWSAERSACLFLLTLPGGHDRCGIYADRPVVCHAYPFVSKGPGLAFRARALCPDGAWSEGSLLERRRRRDVNRAEMQYDIYGEVVARWNARVEAAGPGREFGMTEYYSYLINVYEGLAGVDAALGPGELDRVVMSWRSLPRPEGPEPAWLAYVGRVRALVDGFYPDVPPLAERPMFAQTDSPLGQV
jgi:Fe-S-cluster containining protein